MKNTSTLHENLIQQLFWSEISAELAAVFRQNAILIYIISIYLCTLLTAAVALNVFDKIVYPLHSLIIPSSLIFYLSFFFIGHAIYVMIFVRPKKLFKYYYYDLRTNYFQKNRLLNAFLIIFFMSLFMSSFTSFKTMIPTMNPYSWDPFFAKIDKIVHGGYQAWQLWQPILGYPTITYIINFIYNLWFFIMLAILYWQAFSLRDWKLSKQFYISFVIAWAFLGTGLATLFSSAGPCYYDKIVINSNTYQPLLNYLNKVNESFPIWALDTQKMLWNNYVSDKIGLGGGISAMPSMHVSSSLLFALLGWRIHRVLGAILTIFTAIIMIGSVHLAWHYAIDGYVSIFLTLLIWYAVGLFLGGKGGGKVEAGGG